MKISIIETQFDRAVANNVMMSISANYAARSKCAKAQKNNDKPRQAELHIDDVHIANIAIWGTQNIENFETYEEFFSTPDSSEEFFGLQTEECAVVWNIHKNELSKRGLFVEKNSRGDWIIARFTES